MRVKVLRTKNGHALIEWQGESGPQRALLPADELTATADGTAECQNPDEGVPYGAPWAEIVAEMRATPEALERELRRAGVWTEADLLARPNAAASALQAVYGLDAATLIARARAWERDKQKE